MEKHITIAKARRFYALARKRNDRIHAIWAGEVLTKQPPLGRHGEKSNDDAVVMSDALCTALYKIFMAPQRRKWANRKRRKYLGKKSALLAKRERYLSRVIARDCSPRAIRKARKAVAQSVAAKETLAKRRELCTS